MVTEKMARAPQLESGTCIATAALIESANRVFFHRTISPVHWLDLCTIIEAIVLHDKLAFPMTHNEYAEPLLKPLFASGLADPWWPEGNIINFPGSKEEAWKQGTTPAERANLLPAEKISLLAGWPDKRYESLSNARKTAIDGIGFGFAEIALLPDNEEAAILLWGSSPRLSNEQSYESAALSCLTNGVSDTTKQSAEERAEFKFPHESTRDMYNHYAKHLRDLANDAHATIIKSLVEEPFFDAVSVETIHKDLYSLLETNYEEHVVPHLSENMRVIPEPPFAAIAFSKSSNLNEVMSVAVDLRDSFSSYRSLLTIHRQLHAELAEPRSLSQIISLNKEIQKIEASFSTALEQNVKRFAVDVGLRPRFIFDVLQGVRKLAIAYAPNSYKSLIDQTAEKLIDVIAGCSYMHYVGVYEIVSKYPGIFHLNGTVQRLINKELDKNAQAVLGMREIR
jgi:hypothetical protein